MIRLKEIKDAVLHLLFPHVCAGCGSDNLSTGSILCLRCLDAMPETNYELHESNPVEKLFWGRLQIANGTAQYYFTKESLMQQLMHQFKYKGNKELGIQLGRLMGEQLTHSGNYQADALIPLPLFPNKEKRRGYNQAAILCEGISEVMNIPVLKNVVSRPEHTETQTKKGRIERWKNVEGKFLLNDPSSIKNKHVLLVDDVVTTGATLEACGTALLGAGNIKLSIAALCVSYR